VDVYSSLTCRDLEGVVRFLERAFGLLVDERIEDDRGALRVATVGLGDGRVLLQADLPDELHGSHVGQGWVYVAVADLHAHFRRAKAAGAKVLNEPHDAFEGAQRGCSARDPEGNLWSCGVDRPGG
jgi:uncharacterized glyoxalase superfamily protein PhnB